MTERSRPRESRSEAAAVALLLSALVHAAAASEPEIIALQVPAAADIEVFSGPEPSCA